MTQEAKDALLGRLIREESEHRKHGAFLTAQAAEIGERLEKIGQMLKSNPALVTFPDQPRSQFSFPINESDFSTAEVVRRLMDEIKQSADAQKARRKQLDELGYAG